MNFCYVWIEFQNRDKTFFGYIMNLRFWITYLETSHNGCCKYNISNGAKPNN